MMMCVACVKPKKTHNVETMPLYQSTARLAATMAGEEQSG